MRPSIDKCIEMTHEVLNVYFPRQYNAKEVEKKYITSLNAAPKVPLSGYMAYFPSTFVLP